MSSFGVHERDDAIMAAYSLFLLTSLDDTRKDGERTNGAVWKRRLQQGVAKQRICPGVCVRNTL